VQPLRSFHEQLLSRILQTLQDVLDYLGM